MSVTFPFQCTAINSFYFSALQPASVIILYQCTAIYICSGGFFLCTVICICSFSISVHCSLQTKIFRKKGRNSEETIQHPEKCDVWRAKQFHRQLAPAEDESKVWKVKSKLCDLQRRRSWWPLCWPCRACTWRSSSVRGLGAPPCLHDFQHKTHDNQTSTDTQNMAIISLKMYKTPGPMLYQH